MPAVPSGERGVGPAPPPPPHDPCVGHVYLDVRARLLHCLNDTARRLHQEGVAFTPADLERHPLQFPDGRLVEPAELPLVAAWRNGEPVEASFYVPRAGAPPWQVAWTATPLHDPAGQVWAVLGTVSSLPEGPDWQIIAELAHDLRTPLQSLKLLAAIFDQLPQADPHVRQAVETIRSVSDRALQIGLDLLESCRGPAQRAAQPPSWFALQPFLAGLAHEQEVAARRKNLVLTADLATTAGWEANTDRVRLGRILANLLTNAVRYTSTGGVAFQAAWDDRPTGRVLALGVVDTGPGISQEEQESIFNAFEQGRAAKDQDSGGSGLGLAVVDRLVGELGLTLEVFSEYGRGSEFQLLVPASMLRPVQAR